MPTRDSNVNAPGRGGEAEVELEVAVLGAGIAGLLAATVLQDAGLRVAVFDKGRGVGGRLATRRIGDAVFDHGAQHFTARDPDFREWVDRWRAAGLVRAWSDGFSTADGRFSGQGETRYVGARGMTTFPKRLAEGLRVSTGATAVACRWKGDGWRIDFQERPPVVVRSLVLTPPVPQSLALLQAGQVTLPEAARAALEPIHYAPCLAALLQLPGSSQLPQPGGLWLDGEPLGWIGDNTRKGVSPEGAPSAITIHAGPRFSRCHWDGDPEGTARTMAGLAERWVGREFGGLHLHRWRYATPEVIHPDRCLAVESPGPLVFAGDAFGGPRVEGAALSGLAAAAVLSRIRRAAGDR